MNSDFVAPDAGVRIRATTPADLDYVLAAETVPENAFGITPWDRDEHAAAIEDPGCGHWIVVAEQGDRPVGFVIVRGLSAHDRIIELKRILITEKRRGFGRAALRAVVHLAFERYRAHRLWLDVFTDNEGAWKLYESEGFVREGIHRDCYLESSGTGAVPPRYRSLVILSMLSSDRPHRDAAS